MKTAGIRKIKKLRENTMLLERPVFGHIFGRKCIYAAILAVAFGLLGTWLYRVYERQDTEHLVGEAKEEIYNGIYNLYNELEWGQISEDEFLRTIRYNFATAYHMRGVVFELYCQEDGEVLADSSSCLFVLPLTSEGEARRAWYEIKDTEEFRIFLKQGREILKQRYGSATDIWRSVEMEVDEIYLDEQGFIPGAIRMLYKDEILIEKNLTPVNTDGYTYYRLLPDEHLSAGQLSEQKSDTVSLQENGSAAGQLPEQESDAVSLQENGSAAGHPSTEPEWFSLWVPGWEKDPQTFSDMQQIKEHDGDEEAIILSNGNRGYVNHIILLNGTPPQEYTLYTAGDAQRYRFYIRPLLPAYLALMLFCVFMAWVSARLQYTREKANYDVFRYQRELTNAMAHDLKTPLMTISGYAESLAGNVHTEKREYYAKGVLESVQYMDQLVNHILQFSKTESFVPVLHKNALQADALCRDLLQELNGAVLGKQLTISLEGSASLETDESTLKLALGNLLQNAVKYAPPKSLIRIVLSKECLVFQNHMSGSPQKPVSELRKPFVRGQQERGEMQGSGLGLAIADRSLERLGYSLELIAGEEMFIAKIHLLQQ